ncbi:MAG: 50S ribosomal protein L21 [Actinomycetota bacterium]|nr:50S ribosomal protein L21 [Actinomycetota bacterium]
MYAVIKTGGKQYKVAEGERLDVERLATDGDITDVRFTPVLVVDGGRVVASASDLAGAQVTARVVGEAKGPKIRGFTYKNKSNQRRRWGHRQKYTTIEVTGIALRAPAGEEA